MVEDLSDPLPLGNHGKAPQPQGTPEGALTICYMLPAAAGIVAGPIALYALDLLLSPLGCRPTVEFEKVSLNRATLAVEEPNTNRGHTPGQAEQQDDQ
jgi:hypothetical protein